MIAYVDSSLLTRLFLVNEDGNDDATALIESDTKLVTGTWSRIEVSGALVRAARNGKTRAEVFLDALDATLHPDTGSIREITFPQDNIERLALRVMRTYAIRAMDAWHLACAVLVLPSLAEADESYGFATHDARQASVAQRLGLTLV